MNFRIFKIRKNKGTKPPSFLAAKLRDSATGVIVKRLTADEVLMALYGGDWEWRRWWRKGVAPWPRCDLASSHRSGIEALVLAQANADGERRKEKEKRKKCI